MFKIAFPFLEVSHTIDASSHDVWRIMTDTRLWPYWGPSVHEVKCTDTVVRVGSTGRIKLFKSFWVKFAITEFEEGKYWSWHILGFRTTGHRVEPISATRCRAVFMVPIFAAPYVVVCKMALKRIDELASNTINSPPISN